MHRYHWNRQQKLILNNVAQRDGFIRDNQRSFVLQPPCMFVCPYHDQRGLGRKRQCHLLKATLASHMESHTDKPTHVPQALVATTLEVQAHIRLPFIVQAQRAQPAHSLNRQLTGYVRMRVGKLDRIYRRWQATTHWPRII